ncbi:hypothetical protein POX_e06568 [Penicillium oxalicum]|uniref:Tyrosine specific protein phosphatases domain-containing protein n=1 Tax=Penicillium oxalicum (strain 114-2 / CGMCC 5302) TaxID=933388 RepID=S8ANU8_PENO1|nr:hypothetical protein POX_e06568 [Penicillium oxalicum]EPS27588.1 hypothetical protein PDE_02531 [Penicillium oxalicum 114-2]KAI2788549.1 hypothetical protein POX_e06568 [Penicillium oxalicum]
MGRQSSIDLDSPDRPFDNIINFRDVGRTINHFCGSEILKEGVLYRSARPDDASERDKRRLAEELHLATVIDLRSQTEHQMATRKRRTEMATAGATPQEADLTKIPVPANPDEHICKIPESQHLFISLTGKAFERALLSRLDWMSYLRVITLAVTGYRADAIRIIGETVMRPRGLIGLAQDSLESSMSEFRTIFTTLATSAAYPVLIHCTQGKDRTGIIILLLLLLVGVRMDAMADDYGRSELELVPEFEERMREIRVLGLGEEYTRCPPDYVPEMIAFLEKKYGGVKGYLERIGIDSVTQELIRQKLMNQV